MLRKWSRICDANREGTGCLDGAVIQRLSAVYPVNAIPPAQTRSMARLRRSLRRQGGVGRGVLYCHPMQQPDVTVWLKQHAHLGWYLESDAKLMPGEMRLIVEGGTFMLKW